MIHARYRFNLESETFCIEFLDTPTKKRGYTDVKHVNHLENAIRKARFHCKPSPRMIVNPNADPVMTPRHFKLTVIGPQSDPKAGNEYLRMIAGAFVQFIKGVGADRIEIVGF